jgi:hypothetical protein
MTDRETFISQVVQHNPTLLVRIALLVVAEIVWLAYVISSKLLNSKRL